MWLFKVVMLACLALSAQAQEWPTKVVKFVSPYPPGGSVDPLARLFAAKLSDSLKQQFIVENRTRFEIECYDIGHLYTANHFLERGLVKPPLFIQSVFGLLGGIGPHPEDVMQMKRTADRLFGNDYVWSVLGAGRNQMPIATMSAVLGGNVRVGLEDSLWDGPGTLAATNAAQVRRIRSIIEALSMEVATPDEAREILMLKGGNNVGF